MRIQSKKNSSKTKIAIAVLVFLFVISGIALGYFQLFRQEIKTANRENSDTSKNDDTGADSSADGATDEPKDTSGGSQQGDSDYQTIAPSDPNQPEQDASFPVETAEYRIEMTTNSSFKITLYPIEGQDYDAQLRNYKINALDYLESRFGKLDRYTITWMPESARNI